MSAESPRRSRVGGPLVVPPQPPSDRSLMDAVSGFISDVTLTANPGVDPKDVVQWARFESADVDEPKSESDGDGDILPLLLVVGYGSGVQVWVIQPGGEAQEVLSWRQGSVRVLRILPTPGHGDLYGSKRPLVALCDSAGPGVPYCSLSFISLTGGDQVKSIKFKNPILDVVANKRSIVVSFAERLAVFDACTLEDRLTVTTCYPAPCPFGGNSPSNPVALGDRWLAYAERRLSPTKKSNGGCEGEGVASYTATVLHAAKSLGKGLRGLGESVASSLGGGRAGGGLSQSPSPPNLEQLQPGIVTIIDIEGFNSPEDEDPESMDESTLSTINDAIVAHFVAHSEPIIALKFDASGMMLITADKRGHDFHVFRIHPHPSGPTLASVHHLYILHRGDTTAKVQDISISLDCRWTAVSTMRGTTHVFPITPYGGAAGVRTHASPHVVNRLSRFHRSAGLAADGRSNSPVGENLVNSAWYPNPRLPPYPVPCSQSPLAQLRPLPPAGTIPTHTITRNSSGRQRLSSLSEESQLPLAVCSRWGAVRAPSGGVSGRAGGGGTRTGPGAATQALYVMSAHGYLVQYYINPKPIAGVPKEKVCDDTCIELEVEARAQWPLLRPSISHDIMAPLPLNNILIKPGKLVKNSCDKSSPDGDDRWMSQVEMTTHAGPHRRLWMGPQFVFKTYNATSGTSLSLLDSDAVEVGIGPAVARSNPVNMPGARPIVPVLIESGSASSLEHSPRLSDVFRKQSSLASAGEGGESLAGRGGGVMEGRLKEDLAEAMRETEQGCEWTVEDWSKGEDSRAPHVHRIVNPLGAVVSGASSESPSPPGDREDDCYIMSNDDETLFRPVVSAPRSLPAPDTPLTRPLSTNVLLPVHHVSPAPSSRPTSSTPAVALDDRVVIPARLTHQHFQDSGMTVEDNESATDVRTKSEVIVKQCNNLKSDMEDLIKDTLKDSTNKSFKKKLKDRKNEKYKVVGAPDQSKVLTDCPRDITERNICNVQTYVDEISKAVDNIQIFNDEMILNKAPCISSYNWAKSTTSSAASCNAILNSVIDEVCLDEVKNKSHIFKETASQSSDVSESFVVPLKNITKKVPKQKSNIDKNKTNEESAWEILSNVQHVNAEENEIPCFDTKSDTEGFRVSERKEVNADGNKLRKRKTKFGKQKPLLGLKDEAVEISVSKDFAGEDIINMDYVMPEETPKLSWSAVASSNTRKSAERDTFEATSLKVKDVTPINTLYEDDSFSSKLSMVSNKKNIVVALCDTPESDLCFVDEHHSVFLEPPPLEPLDLVLDEQKIQEMHDSLLDYSQGPPNYKITSSSVLNKSNYLTNNDDGVFRNSDDFISVTSCFHPGLKHYEEELEDTGIDKTKQIEETAIVIMEKSSDEENSSPSLSQTESDDCSNMMTSEMNYAQEGESSVVADEPLTSLVPPAANKANKKKPKRKRR